MIFAHGFSKSSEKKDKELALKQAVSDAKLWEMRFQAVDKSREAYRESGRRLIKENEQLQLAVSQVFMQGYTSRVLETRSF